MVRYPSMGEVIAECLIIIVLALIVGGSAFVIWANLFR
jgi:hypothetical protein